jgi:RNA polymerase sigma-70 factor (ECF subfamily)
MAPIVRRSDLPTTQWSLIARLKNPDETQARAALDEICLAYHYPLYCQIRRRGFSHHDAEDALHEFLLKLMRLDIFGIADAEKGRLRTFLLVALRRFLANWIRDAQRQQGREVGGESMAAIRIAESRFEQDEAAHHLSPDLLYDRQWVQELMRRVLVRLHADHAAKGKSAMFEALRPALLAGGSLAGEQSERLAAHLGVSHGALRTAFHRLLEQFREGLRREILMTVEDRETAKQEFDELRALFGTR